MITKFLDFLQRVDKDFRHSISSKVDLREYATKLVNRAYVSTAIEGDQIIGLVALYCNDTEKRMAYIPFVAVDSRHRGRHISKALVASAIAYARGNGFKTIAVHTENPVALNMYVSLGFSVINGDERKYLELSL